MPADADVVIVAGPKTDFLQPEIDFLRAYLTRGGKVMLMLDPVLKADQPQLTLLQGLAKDWGINVGNDVVLDVSGMGQLIGTDESVPVAASYPAHPITDNFRLLTAYPLTRSVSPVEGGVNGHTAQAIVETSSRSWAETNLKSLTSGQPAKQDDGDKAGPVSLAAVVSAPVAQATPKADQKPADQNERKPETRLVVFGDSDYASNSALGIQGNRDLFMNTIGWLSQQENLISIRPKEADDRRLTMTAAQQTNVNILTVLVIPAFIFGAGVYTWWRRR